MRHTMVRNLLCWAAGLFAAPPVRAQVVATPSPFVSDLTVAVGPTANSLTPYVASDDGSATLPAFPAAGPFQVLAVDLAGRLDLHRFDATRPCRVLTDDGLSRVLLSDGTSIFHYRRGGSAFGYLAVGPDGLPRILLELPGTGIGGATNPFQTFLAASRDGRRVAVSTTLAAGGDVWLLAASGLALSSGSTAANLTGSGALAVDPESLSFATGALFFVVADQFLYRAPTDGSALAAPLVLPPSGGSIPVYVDPEIAVSDDGSTVALLAGASEPSTDLYVVRPATGPAANLTQSQGDYEHVGYAPGEAFGPMLALSSNGSWVSYLKTVAGHKELFVRPATGGAPVQVTADALFESSIDNVIIITIGAAFASAAQVEFAAGGGGNLTKLDVYRADVSAGVTVFNLTGTSGSFGPPFANDGSIAIADAYRVPDSSRTAIVSSPAGGGFTLHLVDSASGYSTAVLGGQSWLGGGVGPAGGRTFFEAVAVNGAPTIYALTGGPAPSVQTFVSVPAGVTIDSLTPSPAGNQLFFVASAGSGVDAAVRLLVPSGALSFVNLVPYAFSRSLAFSHAGGALGFAAATAPAGPFTFLLLTSSGTLAPPGLPSGRGFYLR